ncbi:MAG TPA: DUF4258 domain-containing protein [Dehalococcoidia bacterium]
MPSANRVVYRKHAIEQMFLRSIPTADVRYVLEHGDVIEEYPSDVPFPSRLILGFCHGRPLHVVAADHHSEPVTFVITVYEPDPERWDETFRHRRPS